MPPPPHTHTHTHTYTHTHSSLLYPNALLTKTLATHIFRKLNFFQGSCPFFRNKLSSRAFPELFEDSKIHINPFTAMISMLILLTVCHFIFYTQVQQISRTFQEQQPFSRTPVLENATVKLQDFPGFPGPARTLSSLS